MGYLKANECGSNAKAADVVRNLTAAMAATPAHVLFEAIHRPSLTVRRELSLGFA